MKNNRLPKTNNVELNFTPQECLEYMKERHPDGYYRDELYHHVDLIIRCSQTKRVPAEKAYQFTLNLFKDPANRIYVMAAYYLIKTKDTMELRTLQEVELDIYNYKHKLHINEISIKTQEDKYFTNEAIVKEIYQLEDELETIKEQYQIDPNIEFTGEIVQANGSQKSI